jgi:hypothetical protein
MGGKDITYCDWCGETNWQWNKECWNCHKPLNVDMKEIIEQQINAMEQSI